SSAGKKVIHVGPFGSDYWEITNYTIASPSAQSQFLHEAFDMLSFVTPAETHPIKQIDLPAGQRVLIAQLADILPLWRQDGLPYAQFVAENEQWVRARRQLAFDWFDFDSVSSRLNYHPEGTPKKHSP